MERIRIDGVAVRHNAFQTQDDVIHLTMEPEDIAQAFEHEDEAECFLISKDDVAMGHYKLSSAQVLSDKRMTLLTLEKQHTH